MFSSTYLISSIFAAFLYLVIEVPFYKLASFNIRSQFCASSRSEDKLVLNDKLPRWAIKFIKIE